MSDRAEQIAAAAEAIKACSALVVTCGAGMGVDSGLATFRGRYQESAGWGPIERGEETPYSMCKPRRFDQDAALAWGYAVERYKAFEAAAPHAGYDIILGWRKPMAVFTSNIDSHWYRATLASGGLVPVVEYHGSMRHVQCHRNCRGCITPVNHDLVVATAVDAQSGRAAALYPPCDDCGAMQRFNVCLIADDHFNTAMRDEQLKAFERFLTKWERTDLVVLEIGAGKAIPTVRDMSERIYQQRECPTLVRINVDDPEVPQALLGDGGAISLQGGALEMLRAIAAKMQ